MIPVLTAAEMREADRRTIEEITSVAVGDDVSRRAREFFEKLWCFDQITFDAATVAN